MTRRVFTRFKYAEEYARDIDEDNCWKWIMFRDPDKVETEDGETYDIPQYVVKWEWNSSVDPAVSD